MGPCENTVPTKYSGKIKRGAVFIRNSLITHPLQDLKTYTFCYIQKTEALW